MKLATQYHRRVSLILVPPRRGRPGPRKTLELRVDFITLKQRRQHRYHPEFPDLAMAFYFSQQFAPSPECWSTVKFDDASATFFGEPFHPIISADGQEWPIHLAGVSLLKSTGDFGADACSTTA
jgi:hypothetical protein